MRLALAVVSILVACPAWAQAPLAPPPPAPAPESPPPAPLAPPPPTLPAPTTAPSSGPDHLKLKEPTLGQSRFSRFSRGPGGPLFVFGGIITGIVTGVTLNAGLGGDSRDNFMYAVFGATVVGGLAGIYSYGVYTTVYGSMIDMLAATTGYMLGFGLDLLTSQRGDAQYLIPALAANGALVASAILHANADVDGDGAMIAASGAVYGFWIAALVTGWVRASGSTTNGAAMLVSPLGGLALGSVLATQLHIPAGRTFKLLLLPIGVGLGLLYLGSAMGNADQGNVWALSLVGTAVTFALTAVLTQPEDGAPQAAASVDAPLGLSPALVFVRDSASSLRPALGVNARF